jgi:hypothetical protein
MREATLIELYFEGNLPKENWVEFSELLKNSPESRREFRKLATLDDKLRTDSLSPANSSLTSFVEPNGLNKTPWFIAAACLVFASIVFLKNIRENEDKLVPISEENIKVVSNESAIATLVNFQSAVFSNQRSTDIKDFNLGKYELTSGSIHLRFKTAVDFIFKGPGSFEILGPKLLFVEKGLVRTMVNDETGHEFSILTPDSKYIDWGTEFCLSISPGKKDKIDVLSGLVEIRDVDSSRSICHVKRNNQITNQFEQWNGEFFKSENILSPSRIGGAKKKSRMKTYSTQSDILATFDFNKLYIPGKPGLVPDTVKSNLPEFWKSKKDSIHDDRYVINKSINSPISHGIMHDSSWVSGRWYNTKALALHERESHILLDLEGKLENLSFHTWLKIGNPELPNSVIFGSPEWNNPGDFLVEFTRSKRKPFLSFWGQNDMVFTVDTRTSLDFEWNLIALTIESIEDTLKCKLYVNNQLISEQLTKNLNFIKTDQLILGNMRGDYGIGENYQRPLNAIIDEFVIWNRVLSGKEVENLYTEGKPFEHYLSSLK